MQNNTRLLFNQFMQTLADLNNIADASKKFNVTPAVQQKLEKHIQESSAFLQMINMIPVTEQSGQTIGLDAVPHAGRTNTAAGNRRQPIDVTSMDIDNSYHCVQTNFDTSISYSKLDAWAGHKDFEIKIRDLIVKSQALARIMIGFNGTSIAKDTDRTTNDLLQDVNKGWLQKYRENASQNVMSAISIGETGDYKNLDALVYDAVNQLIDPLYRDDVQLRVIVGRELANGKNFNLINDNDAPTEILAVNKILGMDKIGGVVSMTAPYFPADAILITPPKNLSIYAQKNGRRRHVKDEPEYDRITNYESSNDDYVVEYYEAGCLIEGITAV